MSPSKRLTTQTGVAARSGGGVPKGGPFSVFSPVTPAPVHDGSAPPHPARQKSSGPALPTIGKLWDPPFQPLSRSPPTAPSTTVSASSRGPPAGFGGQGGKVVVVGGFGFGMQRRTSTSGSFRGLVLATAVMWNVMRFEGRSFPFFVCLTGNATVTACPQPAADRSAGPAGGVTPRGALIFVIVVTG